MTKELIEEARDWLARGPVAGSGTEIMRRLADALAAVPDAATEDLADAAEWQRIAAEQTRLERGRAEQAEAERDAALAAIERVRAVCDDAERIKVRNREWRKLSGRASTSTHDPVPGLKEVVAALDGAPEPEWEYGLSVQSWQDEEPEPYLSRAAAQHVIDNPELYRKWTHDNPVTMHRRRKAGPWLPVEGEKP